MMLPKDLGGGRWKRKTQYYWYVTPREQDSDHDCVLLAYHFVLLSFARHSTILQTERAADRIKELLQGENAQGALGIRLGVKRRGCNGLSYTLNYAFEKPDKDLQMESHGVQVFIEPMALFNVVGTVMDWEESELASEFTFNNPNSKGECGCGESFTV